MANGRNSESVVRSSGNVFADLGLSNAGEKQTRVRLAVAIQQIIQARRLSQTAAAALLGINQPKISALVNYHLEGFSVERLLHFLNALDRDVEIVIRKKPRSRKTARIMVTESQLSAVCSNCRAALGLDGRGRPSPHEHLCGVKLSHA